MIISLIQNFSSTVFSLWSRMQCMINDKVLLSLHIRVTPTYGAVKQRCSIYVQWFLQIRFNMDFCYMSNGLCIFQFKREQLNYLNLLWIKKSFRNQEAKKKTILKFTVRFNFHFHVYKANIDHGIYHHSGKYLLFLIN